VRVNSARTPWHAADVDAVAAAGADVIVVPKVESPGELDGLPAPLEAQIETARGLVECERIASVPGLEALVLGPGDLAASLGVPELTIGSGGHVEFALMRVVVAARAFGLAAVDGPFVGLGDDEGLRSSALRSRALGYDGKWCIHPSQIASCNEIYSATDAELERARRILEVPGVGRLDGEMVDEATRRMAEAVLARARDPAPETE
jgi:citrate lyase subunit beta/citryl-CoA lyase